MSGRTNRNRSKAVSRRDQPSTHQSQRAAARGDNRRFEFAQQSYSGPLPAPADLQAYEMILPGTAERIIKAFETQTVHRHDLEQVVIGGSERRSGLGQKMVFVILFTGVVGGIVDAAVGQGIAGASISGAALASGALSYIVGGRPPKAE